LPVEVPAEHRFELFFKECGRHIFAIYSPELYFYRNKPALVKSRYRD
jgi:hypothetical protein